MNFIVLCLCVSLSGVFCEFLNKEKGDKCEWEGLQGTCVEETRCLTTIDDDSPKHPVCNNKLGTKIICCTDCELVNSTKNAIFIPPSGGLFFKSGQKARDKCLQYIYELPYKCKESDYYAGISREFDDENKCYSYSEWEVESTANDGEPSANHPYVALLGYGKDLGSATWSIRGAIISNKYILTTVYVLKDDKNRSVSFVAVGGMKFSDVPYSWQTQLVKRVLPHPNFTEPYFYDNIALIETENTITFNKNVLPACLHVEAAADETAIIPTWRDLKIYSVKWLDTIQNINLDKFSKEECHQIYRANSIYLKNGEIYDTQMCYGIRTNSSEACKVNFAQPLLINTQISRCVYTVIGVTSFGHCNKSPKEGSSDIFTRVASYIPWIESVVWDGV